MCVATDLDDGRGGVLGERQQDADAGAEVLARAHAAHVAVQTAQRQRVASASDYVTSGLQPARVHKSCQRLFQYTFLQRA